MARATNTAGPRPLAWAGANIVPIALIPLAGLLVWVAIWKIWLPPAETSGAVGRTVTTVDANAPSRPTHKVTTVVRTSVAATPSRRSETLAIVLIFLGAGAAVIAVFHDRIGSIELGKDGVKIDLTAAEQSGAAALVARLASKGAGARTYALGLERYVHAVSAGRSRSTVKEASLAPGLSELQAGSLADRIADDVL